MFKVISLLMLFLITPLMAAEFKSDKECIVGSKVADRQNLIGTVVSVDGGTFYNMTCDPAK